MSYKRKNKHSPAAIGSLLAAGGALDRDVYAHARGLIGLQERLADCLGPPLARHANVVNCRAGVLTIHTGSAAWASRLRFRVPELLAALPTGPDGNTIQTIRIRVRPVDPAAPAVDRPAPKLSLRSARLLQSVAESISDPDLSDSLLRLSRNR